MRCFLLFFDGGSRGNPGPGGAGAVIVRVHDHACFDACWVGSTSLAAATTTNTTAEYDGLISGLRAARERGWAPLHVIGDSAMIIRQLRHHRAPRAAHLAIRFGAAHELSDATRVASWSHHYRRYNKCADAAANLAMDTRASIALDDPRRRPALRGCLEHLVVDVHPWMDRHHDTLERRARPDATRPPAVPADDA